MSEWFTNSPYWDIGAYLGGINYSGDNSAFTSSWVSSVISEGWDILPIWVGRQAPCLTGMGFALIDTDPSTARSQGITTADNAISAAGGVNINSGSTILYLDVEGYGHCNGTIASENAVNHYVNGWVLELQANDYKAGVYGSTCDSNVVDWASLENVPNVVWPASSGSATVWNLNICSDGSLSNSDWNGQNDRRVHQYAFDAMETYGGIGPFTIDRDCSNGTAVGTNHNEDAGSEDESSGGTVEDPNC